MKYPSDKKTPLPYDKKPVKGNTLDYYNDDMSRKAVGKLFDDDDDKQGSKSKAADDTGGLEGSAEYIDLEELENYIQKKHVNISSVYEDTGDMPYDISMYQDKPKEKPPVTPQKSTVTRPTGTTPVSKLKPAQGSARTAPGEKPSPGPTRTSTLKRPPTRKEPNPEKNVSRTKAAMMPGEINAQIKVAALVIVVVFLAILAALIYRMNSLSAELKAANEIALQYNPDTERELNELRIMYSGLQEENDRLQGELERASTDISSQPTIPSNTQTPDTDEPDNTPPTSQPTPSTTQGERKHVVVTGDNLYNISRQYYGSPDYVSEIMRANNMTTDSLRPGDELIIPAR